MKIKVLQWNVTIVSQMYSLGWFWKFAHLLGALIPFNWDQCTCNDNDGILLSTTFP
jgi:hypothetical protein